MPNDCLEIVREGLLSVGHRREQFCDGIATPGLVSIKQGFVAYADRPFDARTSTFVAVDKTEFHEDQFALLQSTGAPIIAQCAQNHVLLWKQSPEKASFIERIEAPNILSFFQKHQDELAPGSIYRAKLWGRTNRSWQLDLFVDTGLLPLVERTAGEDLRHLLEGAVKDAKSALGSKQLTDDEGSWLLKAIFWLLAAKILEDKGVRGFVQLNLQDVEQVYSTLAKHYNRQHPRPVPIANAKRRQVLVQAAATFQRAASMAAVTTESLAWVYESALIDKLTRKTLGTHSTPTWLIDDIVAKLRPWIEEMPVDDRRVFEPACGHAGFLISAMRLLSELLPSDRAEDRKTYLRQRLRGIEIDPFAYEIARLSLTLADVPNGNGWQLENADMFSGNLLPTAVAKSMIVLANPPFEKFGDHRPANAEYFNQADETFRHIVEALPVGGVFGVVLPQTFLHSSQAKPLRQRLLDEYELSEVTLFADKVFNYGESETAVLLGRRIGAPKEWSPIRYRRVRESQIENYKKTLEAGSTEIVKREFVDKETASLFLPDLEDVWQALRDRPSLGRFIQGGKGLEYKGENDPTLPTKAIRESATERPELAKGFSRWNESQLTHQLPEPVWLNLDEAVIRRPLHGTTCGQKQILLNYGRISREAWRLKCLLDKKGHPVTSRFLVFRSTNTSITPTVLWALCNSPVANAYAYAHSTKRDVLGSTLHEMPAFDLDRGPFEDLEKAIAAYFKGAKGARAITTKKPKKSSGAQRDNQLTLGVIEHEEEARAEHEDELKYLHWRIDAEVLRLYELPAWAERKILDLFTGVRRRGVPFVQDYYFPKGFNDLDRLSDLLAITADWSQTNERRCELIRKDVKKRLDADESTELQHLESLADARSSWMDVVHPREPDALDAVMERLKREGKWPA